MRRHGDDANVSVFVSSREVVLADAQQASVLALSTGIGLAGARGEAGDLRQVAVEGVNELLVAFALAGIFFRGVAGR